MSNQALEVLICQREAIVARIKGMEAENAARLSSDQAPAYLDDRFYDYANQLDELSIRMRDL